MVPQIFGALKPQCASIVFRQEIKTKYGKTHFLPLKIGAGMLCFMMTVNLSAQADSSSFSPIAYQELNRMMESNHYDETISTLKGLVAQHGTRELWQCLGTAYYRKGDLHKAEQSFRLGLTVDQNYWYLWGGLARVLFDLGKYDESKRALAKADLLKSNSLPDGTIASANSSSVLPAVSKAESPAGSTAEYVGGTSKDLGSASSLPGVFSEARTTRKVMDTLPDSSQPSSAPKTVSEDFETNANTNTTNTNTQNTNPISLPRMEDLYIDQRKSGAFTDASATFPGKGERSKWVRASHCYNLGIDLLSSGQYEEACKKFREAIEIYPYDPDFFHNLGFSLKRLRKYPEAEKAYRDALSLNQRDWDTWCNLGSVLYDQKRYSEARDAFRSAESLGPTAYGREHIEWFKQAIARHCRTL